MKKKLALTTCNESFLYYRWIPFAIEFWERLGFDFICHFYGKKIPPYLHQYQDYLILESPIKEIPTPSLCQVARLYLPSLHRDRSNILVTDVDLLPLSQIYFSYIDRLPKGKFIALRKKGATLFMGFNIASPEIWQNFSGISPTRSSIEKKIIENFRNFDNRAQSSKEYTVDLYWNLDQILLNYYFQKFDRTKKMALTAENNWSIILSGFTKKMAYYHDKGMKVTKHWIRKNAEDIIFYTRDDERRLIDFEQEIKFLKNIYF